MRRISYRPYLFLVLFFFVMMGLPQGTTERIRSSVVCAFAPGWRSVNFLREKSAWLLTVPTSHSESSADTMLEVQRLAQENQLLHAQIESVREWLLYEDRIQEQVERYKSLVQAANSETPWKEFFKRRSLEFGNALDMHIRSLPAKVIFREPASWSSTLWINVGEDHNRKLGKKIIAKNSPVVLGTSLIGIIEYVGANRSKVRLITDSRLTPAVRAVRGNEQSRYLLEQLETLIFALELRDDLFSSKDEASLLMQQLSRLRASLQQQTGGLYLAKGEIHGTSHPLWRSRSQVLKGFGFNYDCSDREGPARDLRSGEPYDPTRKGASFPLLRPGDLLLTTGLDGIFPPGFRVATVSFVHTLKEGASSYEIEAVSTAGNLDELSHVFVLVPFKLDM